jgi:hypothetical protein
MPVERIEPAYDGINTDSAPDTLRTEAPVLTNFLVDRPGKLPMRGPINGAVQMYSGAAAEKPIMPWVHNNNLLVGLKANSATAVRDPWVAPFRRAAAEAELADGHTTAYHLNLETGVTSSVAVTQDNCPGSRFTRLGDFVWGTGYSRVPANTFTSNGGIQNKTNLLRWDGTVTAPTAYVNGPLGFQDIRAHLNRLFAAGGLKPSTTTYSPNSLFYSDLVTPGTTPADTLAFWQSDIAPNPVNELVIDSNDPSDFIVALAKVGRALAIFKRRSIHLLLGETSDTFVVRPFTTETGCVDPRSVLEYQDGVFFASDQGLIWFDGQQLINVTQDQRSTIVAAITNTVGNRGVDGGRAVTGRLPNDYIFFGVGVTPNTAGPSLMDFTGIYHPPRTAWAELTSDALSGGRPVAAGRSLQKTFLVDDTKVIGADAVTAPESVDAVARGFDTSSVLFTFPDGGVNVLFDGTGNAARNPTTQVQAWTTEMNYSIQPTWHSKLARLAQPLQSARIARLAVDYTFQTALGADDAANGWLVSLIDGRGNTLMIDTPMPSQGAASIHAYRRQFVKELNVEADDAQLRVTFRGAAIALADAAIFNAYLDYESTHLRGSR